MDNRNKLNPNAGIASNPVIVWLVIGLGIGIGLGILFDSPISAIAGGMVAGLLVGFYIQRRRKS